jgi:hypothetical protein
MTREMALGTIDGTEIFSSSAIESAMCLSAAAHNTDVVFGMETNVVDDEDCVGLRT